MSGPAPGESAHDGGQPSASSGIRSTSSAYDEALRALEARGRYGIRLGLERVQALLRELGDPQRAVRGALVAGTNGKGSVIALAGSALRAAGYRVGETPKPHLVTYRERIVVDGHPIAAQPFARLVEAVLPIADLVARDHGEPTEFELLTAILFRHFADVGLDVALVEVGLGGRLDATHAWDGGVAVVTNVGLDHMAQLGTTVPAIAREKAAIVERGDIAVTGATGAALQVVEERCREVGVPLTRVAAAPLLGWDRDSIRVDLGSLGATRVALRGRHQAANVAVADATLDALATAGIVTVPAAARREGYAAARWPGRLERIVAGDDERAAPGTRDSSTSGPGTRRVEVLLDGAHNADGARALAAALDDLRPWIATPVTLLWATMADKDVDGVIDALGRSGVIADPPATVICTTLGAARAMPSGELAARWRARWPGLRVEEAAEPGAALDRALALAAGWVVVAGSLYLVGAVRARLVDDPDLREPGGERA